MVQLIRNPFACESHEKVAEINEMVVGGLIDESHTFTNVIQVIKFVVQMEYNTLLLLLQ